MFLVFAFRSAMECDGNDKVSNRLFFTRKSLQLCIHCTRSGLLSTNSSVVLWNWWMVFNREWECVICALNEICTCVCERKHLYINKLYKVCMSDHLQRVPYTPQQHINTFRYRKPRKNYHLFLSHYKLLRSSASSSPHNPTTVGHPLFIYLHIVNKITHNKQYLYNQSKHSAHMHLLINGIMGGL